MKIIGLKSHFKISTVIICKKKVFHRGFCLTPFICTNYNYILIHFHSNFFFFILHQTINLSQVDNIDLIFNNLRFNKSVQSSFLHFLSFSKPQSDAKFLKSNYFKFVGTIKIIRDTNEF